MTELLIRDPKYPKSIIRSWESKEFLTITVPLSPNKALFPRGWGGIDGGYPYISHENEITILFFGFTLYCNSKPNQSRIICMDWIDSFMEMALTCA